MVSINVNKIELWNRCQKSAVSSRQSAVWDSDEGGEPIPQPPAGGSGLQSAGGGNVEQE